LEAYLRRLMVLYASRKLLRNWISAGVQYYLIRSGLSRSECIEVVSKDGFKSSIPAKSYRFLVNDYYAGYITDYDGGKGIVTYANKMHVPVKEVEKLSIMGRAVGGGWVYDEANGFWAKGNLKFKRLRETIFEVFDYGDYEPMDVKDRIVVDAGAFIGDSAIYFALKGAKKVIAIEPYPSAYAEMLENIKLNSLEGVIVPVNAGLASKPSKICVEDANVEETAGTYHRPGNCSNPIPAVTLGELLEKFNINGNEAVLKMDCEGCEYDVILNDYEHVSSFSEVYFEYHAFAMKKPVDLLLEKMRNDFKCRTTSGKEYAYRHGYKKEQLGLISCKK